MTTIARPLGRRLPLWPTVGVGAAAWLVAWLVNLPASEWVAYDLLGLARGSHLGDSVAFFLLDVPKVLLLLTGIVTLVSFLRSFVSPERVRRALAGRGVLPGTMAAAGFGVLTPFCSCSAVPLFIGFVEAGVPLGVTFSFLIAAPMVNEIALAMLFSLFGWKVALLYAATGLLIAVVAGWVIGRLRLERFIEEWVLEIRMGETLPGEVLTWSDRFAYARLAVKDIVGKVWPWVLAGIAVGAVIHGWVPEAFLASVMGAEAWWSVPLAVLVGIPMYSNAAGIIPVVEALLDKGAAIGTALAFMMAVIGLSLPETIILRKVLKPPLIAAFIGTVAVGILIVGYVFNLAL